MGFRKHCNPFTFRDEVEIPDWSRIFPIKRPLELDIGCGKGEFSLERAVNNPEINIVGLEIREPFYDIAQRRLAEYKGNNLFFLRCNASASLEKLFKDNSVNRIHIYFPDPWFKKRHHKRRVVTPVFLDVCAKILEPKGEIHLASDVEVLAYELLEMCEAHRALKNIADIGGFLKESPFAEKSNWEAHLVKIGKPFWRMGFYATKS